MHNLWIPVVAILLIAGLIFGSQAVSDAKRDAHIATRIAEHLETHDKGEISHLRTVNKGYGLCGDYLRDDRPAIAFYYHTVTKKLAVGTNATRYRENCARTAR
ncbi:hypothetical protein [Halomonas caseinilytica]|uniref:Uncharacterized protein n=1 Tax=Halomonas caseinilytica TaxID=438744 RepID=A0A1M7A2K4_9GAMM|nr:hypothetical protein [Halomonas caseinilytica]SEN32822.1 hypothetical protein SAMN04487952_11371 [Halomonas caseinilytica]SHL36981.1 hypothetical protein SAMN05192556_1126 [Halomonas caseinilytica]